MKSIQGIRETIYMDLNKMFLLQKSSVVLPDIKPLSNFTFAGLKNIFSYISATVKQ